MISNNADRRTFLQQLAAGTLSLGLFGISGGCGPILQAIQTRPVRRNIATLAANDPIIETYREAVAAMKALPSTDGRNWQNQANIHLNHCPHSNWFFLPWHRAYLFYFEQICRELTGNMEFALPYWNWTTSRSIPAPFWGGAANPLFDGTRVATQTSQASNSYIGAPVIESILDQPNFLVFGSGQSATQRGSSTYGQLEATPHNNIHGFVGGNMGTYVSPRDPVFWCHHNMIDCLWVDWNIVRGHPNTNDPNWMNFAFTNNFYDGQGNLVPSITVAQTLLMPILAYRCQDIELTAAEQVLVERFLREGAPVRIDHIYRAPRREGIEVVVGQPVRVELQVEQGRLATAATRVGEERVLLTLSDVTLPPRGDFHVRVFIDPPARTAAGTADDAHLAGTFGFFVHEGHPPHGERPGYVLDVTDAVRRLAQAGRLGGGGVFTVHLDAVPHTDGPPAANRFRIGALEAAVVREPDPQARLRAVRQR